MFFYFAAKTSLSHHINFWYCIRFYSAASSYVHGGKYCDGEPEKPVIGQAVINKTISICLILKLGMKLV